MRKLLPLMILLGAVIHGQAQVDFTSNSVCFGSATMLTGPDTTDLGSVITKWMWDLDNDGMYDDDSGRILYRVLSNSGSLTVGLETTSATVDSASNTVIVMPTPLPNFKPENICRLTKTTYYSQSTIDSPHTISLYGWDFEDDGNPDGDGSDSATWTYTGVDMAVPTRLTTTSTAGCVSSVVKSISVFNEAVANFTIGDNVTFGDSTTFDNLSYVGNGIDEKIILYAWDFGDGETSTLQFPKHRFSNVATYDVTLTVVTENFCQATFSEKVTIIDFINEGGVTVINNIMTPNADGHNDYLLIDDIGSYSNCTITVYSQWNQEVYTNAAYDNRWDGTKDGSPLDPGTYFYIIQCDEKEKTVGSINILR